MRMITIDEKKLTFLSINPDLCSPKGLLKQRGLIKPPSAGGKALGNSYSWNIMITVGKS